MPPPLASIIINNYNYGRFLGQAIESALEQTYPCVEVIVVDDGSEDHSADIIRSYGDRVVSVLKANGGMGSTYNAGFEVSSGELVLLLDSDDFLLPTAVASAASALSESGACKVHWPLYVVDASGHRTGQVIPGRALQYGDLRDRAIASGPDACLSPPTSGNAFAREFLNHVLPMPASEYRQHADSYLTTLALVAGRIAAVAGPQACHRLHGSNDYACLPSAEKNRRNLAMYELRSHALQALLQHQGLMVDAESWTESSYGYQWMLRFEGAARALQALLPKGCTFVLVDDASWTDGWGPSEVLAGRRHLPFIERNGEYYGPPADDATAIDELERLRGREARFIVFAWPAFWWLTHYARFAAHLRERYRCLHDDSCAVVFGL